MKNLLIVLVVLFMVSLLSATHLTPVDLKSNLELSYGGDFVTRAIMNNDISENDGGWFDNRLRLDFYAKFGEKIGFGWKPQIGYNQFSGFGTNGGITTRELYMDYSLGMYDTVIRMGRQYWADHRSLVLDDYFAGISADMKLSGFNCELGFLKANEGVVNKLDDEHAVWGTISSEAPVNWGATLMFGQNHASQIADVWLIPYANIEADIVNIDFTAVIDNRFIGDDDSETGIGIAAKAEADLGLKVGLDLLYVTEDGINSYSPYYENGLYLFGNKLPFDGSQIETLDTSTGEALLSTVFYGSYNLKDNMELFGAAGMVSYDDPVGTEVNVGLNYTVTEGVKLCPVIAVGSSGKSIDSDENFVYMGGCLVNVEF